MKNNRFPGPDNIVAEIIQEAGDIVMAPITDLYNKCLESENIQEARYTAEVIIIHKKGDI